MIYKGYIDTSLGSELVAVKTGQGICYDIEYNTNSLVPDSFNSWL